MELPRFFESWSWLAGVISAALALLALAWQMWPKTRRGRFGDWEVLDRAFHGVRIGASIRSLQSLPKPIARDGEANIKMTKWLLETGNELSVTYDSEQDRILYAELDWNFKPQSTQTGISELRFGETTLEQIRVKFGSSGFTYVEHMIFKTPEGIVTFNAFELKSTPTIVVVFVTLLQSTSSVGPDPSADQLKAAVGGLFKLVGVAVADESYLDQIWGAEKLYDPKSIPIQLWRWNDDA